MAIYVDDLVSYGQQAKPGAERYFGNGKQSCHLTCDGNLEELHAFADSLGLRRSWFQRGSIPHYDLTPNKRAAAVRAGAQQVSTVEAIKRWRASQGWPAPRRPYLRRAPRSGEGIVSEKAKRQRPACPIRGRETKHEKCLTASICGCAPSGRRVSVSD